MDFEQAVEGMSEAAERANVRAQIHANAGRIFAAFIETHPKHVLDIHDAEIDAMRRAAARVSLNLSDDVERELTLLGV